MIDIVPTYNAYQHIGREFAEGYFHWFFLTQPAPLPETMIGRDPELFLRARMLDHTRRGAIDGAAFAEYLRCSRDAAAVHSMCEDYRASASIDLEHDAADLNEKIRCPLLVLWAEHALMHRLFDVLAVWKERGAQVTGKALPGGHFLAEDSPAELLAALREFLGH